MPKSVSTLCNLQTLILRKCFYFRRFPSELWKLINLRHLDISGAGMIKGMPSRIGELRSLRTLPDFIVGENYSGSSGIGELRNLLYLKGELCISRLRNVTNAEEARKANLVNKEGLSALKLQWNNDSESVDSSAEFDILEALRPHQKLEELTIEEYRGDGFPSWMKDASFSNMRVVRLKNCQNCALLPTMGKLPVLKELTIIGMNAVKKVGSEFYWGQGSCSSSCSFMAAFQSLETLNFEDMGEWEVWEVNAVMPKLRKLIVKCCPKLMGELPINKNIPPLLEVLSVEECGQLVVSFSEGTFPSLREIDIFGCNRMVITEKVDFKSLVSLTAYEVREVDVSAQFFSSSITGLPKLEELRVNGKGYKKINMEQQQLYHHLNTLRSLEIEDAFDLVSLEGGGGGENQQGLPVPLSFHTLTSIEYLSICNCESLVSFPDTGFPPTLRRLCIDDCAALKCIFLCEAERPSANCLEFLDICACPFLTSISSCGQLLPCLKSLRVDSCSSLTHISSSGQLPPCLESLDICNCPSLRCILSSGQLLPRLKSLDIVYCSSLTCILSSSQLLPCLESLNVNDCPSLTCILSSGQLLPCLKSLEVYACPSLLCISSSGQLLPCLKSLKVFGCPSLTCISSSDQLLPCLESLKVFGCPSLTCISSSSQLLPCLKSLEVRGCSSLTCISSSGQLLPYLKSLDVFMCPFLTCVSSRGPLPSSLEKLRIWDCEGLESVAVGGMAPHSSLQSFCIECCPELKSLPDGLEALRFLDEIKLYGCRNLESLPQGGLPTTLRSLVIHECEKLKDLHNPIHHLTSLTELRIEGPGCEDLLLSLFSDKAATTMLPTSLRDLSISNFPNLEKLSSKPFQNHNLSLQFLQIRACPKLTSISRHLLPPSLLSLEIFGCPRLKPKFAKGKGQLWPKIQYIPRVDMDGNSIFDPEPMCQEEIMYRQHVAERHRMEYRKRLMREFARRTETHSSNDSRRAQ
ncbi:putative disease resistance protein At3g14460 isoform X2 [Malania oleifera]|nr:putative disease resistance protein At3g14460 isoform X2 [Malania oleifera]XP_057978572.1 putative disease resistance protein At3g14460 isoform X2 [Malania oleifera]